MNKKKMSDASKLLIEHEQQSSSSSYSSPAASSAAVSTSSDGRQSPIEKLLSCLTREGSFTKKDLENAIKSNGHELLKYGKIKRALEEELAKNNPMKNTLTPAQSLLNGYQLCEDIICGLKSVDDYDIEIRNLCYESWEDKFDEAIENETTIEFLTELRQDCATRLENLQHYQDFKKKLTTRYK